jgi:hypothetical protein
VRGDEFGFGHIPLYLVAVSHFDLPGINKNPITNEAGIKIKMLPKINFSMANLFMI